MNKLHLVTGYMGEEHIHSADQGSFNAAFFGSGEYVTESGNQFEASIMDNNTVRILDGDALMKGRHLRIEPNTYADVTITTGTAGVNRNDLIVFQYSKDTSTDIESLEIVVIKGTEAEGTATDPAYTDGDILGGATFNQMPMYRVKVEGVVLTAVEPLFTVIPTYKKLAEQYAKQFEDACNTFLGTLNILDTKEEIEANTKENQLAGALALKEVIASLSQIIEDNSTIRYVCGATDTIQIKDDESVWHNYASGGLTSTYLVKNGQVNTDFCGDLVGGTGGWDASDRGVLPTINKNNDNITITTNGTNIDSTGSSNFENLIDLTNVNSLTVEFSANVSLESGFTRRVPIILYIGSSVSGTLKSSAVKSANILNKSVQSSNGKMTIDTSSLSGSYYIGFALYDQNYDGSTYPNTTTTLTIYNVKLD